MLYNIIALTVIVIAILFIFFANSYFIMGKTKELAIAGLSGVNVYKLSQYLFHQNFIIMLIALPLGLLLGIAVMPLFLTIVNITLGINGGMWAFSKMGIICSAVVIAMQCILLVLLNTGYVYKNEIINLISIERAMYKPDTRTFKIPRVIYLIIYLIPIVLAFIDLNSEESSYFVFDTILIGVYGMQGVIQYFLPAVILKLKKKKYIHDKIRLISLSNLHYSLRKSSFLIVLFAVSNVMLIWFICIYRNLPRVKAMSIFSYVIIVLLLAICIIYKVAIEAVNRKSSFKQLKLIGYNSNQIKRIIGEEVAMFYSIAIGTPLIYIIVMIVTQVKAEAMGHTLAFSLLGVFLIVFCLAGAVSYVQYKRIVNNYLKEM
jgi:putative ABC transport system permease protein